MNNDAIGLVSGFLNTTFSVLILLRLWRLRKEDIKVIPGYSGFSLLITTGLLLLSNLYSLTTDVLQQDRYHVVLSVASVVATALLCPLLYLEHVRSTRPADLAVIFLLVSLVCDLGASLQEGPEEWLIPTTKITLKFLLIAAESRSKQGILKSPYSFQSPEQLAGILSRTFFWWINPILALGNQIILSGEDLPPIDHLLTSEKLRHDGLKAWDQRARPLTKITLPICLVKSMLPQFMAPVVLRLCLIFFRYAQPALISSAVHELSSHSDGGRLMLIMKAATVYFGLAVFEALYHHRLNRLSIITKGTLIGLINNAALRQSSSSYNDGIALTLISTDTESVMRFASMFHETWAHVLEVIIGMAMLARQIRWAAPVPLVIIFFCSRMSRYLARNLQSKQKAWNEATQRRISLTASAISSMKVMKMLGTSRQTEVLIQKLRAQELEMAKKVRWMMVAYNASANALGIFSPILTFVIFVMYANVRGSTLDAETAFTTTALLGLVTHPANMIMTIVPRAIGSLAAFGRIQDYLVRPGRADERRSFKPKTKVDDSSSAICFEAVTVQSHSQSRPVLDNINFTVNQGSIVICAGAVGSGKTVLAQCILGEIPASCGTISVSTQRIAYCEQSPWLPSGTLKEVVCGFGKFEPGWYRHVVKLCCLDEDILALPLGDNTVIGSRGLKLSGGQRQRLALARALYARGEIVLLDDSFSALDHNTERKVVSNLLGTQGHFRKTGTTVFLIANSTKHFDEADSLIILESGRVTYQGSPNAVNEEVAHLRQMHVNAAVAETNAGLVKTNKTIQSQALEVTEAVADLGRSTGDFTLYGYYLRAVHPRNFFILLTCTASYSFFVIFPQYWLQKWTESPGSQAKFYIAGYLTLSLLAWVATNGSMWSTHMLIAPTSGDELHRRLLSTVFGAPLLFFSFTETGSILNRFSEDMQLVDKSLPPAILSLSNQIFKLLVQTALLFSAQKLLTATIPLCVLVVYVVQRVYLRTSRQLRLLQLESQSAVYSSFLESVEGVVSIRSFGWVKQAESTNMNCLDKSQQPAYILLCLQLWLNIVLDLVIASMAVILIALAVFLEGSTTAGQIGMSLNIVLVANSTLLALVTSWTNLEISLGAISRLKTLEEETVAEEQPVCGGVVPETWPSRGALQVHDLMVSYEETHVPALKNINLSIEPGQHLVICGRTGSGKSTLLLALLRLLDTQSGSIEVDGIDLSQVPLSTIRERCFIIVTQDPFLLAQASLRFNLDPSETLSDIAILKALERTGLCGHFDTHVQAKLADILDSPLSSLPHMSTGQTQLFALTRALLRAEHCSIAGTKPILLLDEATSSVDGLTESTMRRVVKEAFTDNGHTVIEITHRLSGLKDIAQTAGHNPEVSVVLLSQGGIQRQGRIEDMLDFGNES
ncbi:related to multidrug resistance protein [Fusarium fujikuroi]|nr:related to multidrug resistance protein [Fusarium fujikuroi]SCN76601.1 related to multidrug resistance protein [Fusarium fujikuroi]SCN87305.1 related to multidrug resistance protein [Fusarium fujikuroi]SCN93772.1 related to multidrug resistance protein [Fusarium fujikuroi]SCO46711.1 related to multidrug resistance protein [Fusarium fujikuroi]